jgi:hypothetical protein
MPDLRRPRLPGLQAERLGGTAALRLVNPNVLRMSGIDPDEWNGFAFGLGLTRLAMMRYAIDDIRHAAERRSRFLNSFDGAGTRLEILIQLDSRLVSDLDCRPANWSASSP